MKKTHLTVSVALVLCAALAVQAGCGSSKRDDPGQKAGRAAAPVVRGEDASAPAAGGAWLATVQGRIAAEEYRIAPQGDRFHAANRAHNLRARIGGDGTLALEPRDGASAGGRWSAILAVTGFGRKGAMAGAGTGEAALGGCAKSGGEGLGGDCARRLEVVRDGMVEWFENSPAGLEQGFDVTARPAGAGSLAVELAVTGLDVSSGGDGSLAVLSDRGAPVLWYGGLSAVDARGNALGARMEIAGSRITLVVDDEGAAYPVAIDPLLTSPSWTGEADQNSAGFGVSVSAAGDVNGDGYGDVIVGAYLYDNVETDEGAAFVYHGSASGLPASPAWRGEANLAAARYGAAVSTAGDVNNDGFADIIVGAYTLTNGQTSEGRAYIYHGSSTGLPSAPNRMLEVNSGNAYFGFAVSTAGDVNGDGYSDVIVGAFGWTNSHGSEGGAFVYCGSSSGIPSSWCWTKESDTTSASFGKSVAGGGDLNGDGYGDVIIGADSLTNGHSSEGRAYVYYGSSSGLGVAPWTYEPNVAGYYCGGSVAMAGDVNGDGFPDAAVGCPGYTGSYSQEGIVYVFHGSLAGPSASPSWSYRSNQASAYLGGSVSGAGDVNGDGYADLLAGAYMFDSGQTDEGRAFLFYGSSTGLASSPGWTGESDQAGASYGFDVSGAGDVNGDGYADVVAGAYAYDNGQTDEGRAYLYFGSPTGLATTAAWGNEGNQASAYYGYSVSRAGDVNGDGYADVIVGAYQFDSGEENEGKVFVYQGSATGLATTAAWGAEVNQANAFFGFSVAGAGDVNGDGYGDALVGAYIYDNGQTDEGRAFVYYGSATGLPATASWTAESDQAGAYLGFSVAGAGDVNGDGFADVIAGAFYYDNGSTNEGRAFVYHGSATGLGAAAPWAAESNQLSAYFGNSVSGAGDVNGDGYSDVIVGAHYFDNAQSDEGTAFVYHGSATGLGDAVQWSAESNQPTAYFGISVAGAGDVNGDGFGDVIVGAYQYDNDASNEGRAYVYHGSASGLSGTAAWIAEPGAAGDSFGYSVAGAGDVNGDGYGDVIVGAYEANGTATDEGRAYVYQGSASGLAAAAAWSAEPTDQATAYFGRAVSGAGDVNGDGFADVIVGAPNYDNPDTNEGRAYVFYGNGGGNLSYNPRQRRTDINILMQPYAFSDYANQVTLTTNAKSPWGGQKVKLQWEVKPHGTVFNGTGLGLSSSWTDTGAGTAELVQAVTGLTSGDDYNWRMRVVYNPMNPVGGGFSHWVAFDRDGDLVPDFRLKGINGRPCEAGFKCLTGNCVAGTCCNQPSCNDNNVCTADTCSTGTCANTPGNSGTLCRASAGVCDAAESCTGTSAACPADVLSGTAQVCRGAAGACDAVEYCTGTAGACPADALSGTAQVCRAGAGVCDAVERCTGTGVACPGDLFSPTNAECRTAAGVCDVAEYCPGGTVACPADALRSTATLCRAGAGVCDAQETCDGSGAACPADLFAATAVLCRATAGICDVDERCTGSQAGCPANSLVASGTACRAAAGICDAAEACTGASAACPADALASTSVACRTAAGACDAPERCTGTTVSCPADALLGTSVTCRALAGACDVAESCTGTDTGCPGNTLVASGTVCRGAAGVCDNAEACTGSDGACPADAFAATSLLCRASAGLCDVDERCTGSLAACPANGFLSTGTICRADGGVCDAAETCTGSGASCPADVLSPTTAVCRAAVGGCDAVETCSGASNACPSDGLRGAGSVCRAAAGVCDVAELCSGTSDECPSDTIEAATTICRAAGGMCDQAESCTGTTTACPANGFTPSGQLCRAAAGICDSDESCTGTQAACPSNAYKPSSTVCRADGGVCDAAETCTGSGAGCPADILSPTTAVCRTAAGGCDAAERCTGTSAGCPGDLLLTSGSTCRGAAGVCDTAETCSGTSDACPADVFADTARLCRAAAGFCDVAETCTGTGGACPANLFVGTSQVCRSSNGICDQEERCTGATGTCPANAFQPTSFECRADGGVCDAGETCTGSLATCPADTLSTTSQVCRAGAGVCDAAETCTGTDAGCPADELSPTTSVCRAGAGVCDVAESCTGSLATCPADTLRSTASVCRAGAGVCDAAESCTGTGTACPANQFAATTLLCRGAAGFCDVDERCSGTTAFCPSDRFEPTTLLCRAGGGVCDAAETCTGSTPACPADAFSPTTSVCRGGAGVCDAAETCTGTGAACPSDAFLTSGSTCRGAAGQCDAAESCSGSALACPADDPAAMNGQTCDDGLVWTETDICTDGSCAGTENGSCDNPNEAATLPYSYSDTTTGRESHLGTYGSGCGDTSKPAADAAYSFTAEAGVTYEITVDAAEGFDAAVALLASCEDSQECLAWMNAAGEGGIETVIFTATTAATYYVVVEGNGAGEEGDFDIAIAVFTAEEGVEEIAEEVEGEEEVEGAEDEVEAEEAEADGDFDAAEAADVEGEAGDARDVRTDRADATGDGITDGGELEGEEEVSCGCTMVR